MTALLNQVSAIVTEAISWIGDFVTVVTSTPLLLLFVTMPLVGLGIGLLKRLIKL